MRVRLDYGVDGLDVELPDDRVTVIEPHAKPALADPRAALAAALRAPLGRPPLRDLVRAGQTVAISVCDVTRAQPRRETLEAIFAELPQLAPGDVTILIATGTHRINTPAEIEQMLGREIAAGYRIVNHDSRDASTLVSAGTTTRGVPVSMNRIWMEADVRITTGFVEPHFFAGFSGGPKGIMPGIAGLHTVMSNHGARNIGDPKSAFGITEGNPIWEEMRDIALRAGQAFLLNVTLNETKQITGVFAGDLLAAHKVGFEFVRRSAMQKVKSAFEVVVTTNSGYPLDLNLYQGVKGMSAAARIVQPGGTIILACECREGVPAGSPLDALLRSASSPEEILAMLATPGFVRPEQWQAQIQSLIQRRANVLVYSSLTDEVIRSSHLKPCRDITATVKARLSELGPEARVAVLPQGPLTIPYLA